MPQAVEQFNSLASRRPQTPIVPAWRVGREPRPGIIKASPALVPAGLVADLRGEIEDLRRQLADRNAFIAQLKSELGIGENHHTLGYLLGLVSNLTGLTRDELRSTRRQQIYVVPRHTYCWLAKRFTSRSLPAIARYLGNRDHTTALHSVRKAQAVVDAMPFQPPNDPGLWATALLDADWPHAADRRP